MWSSEARESLAFAGQIQYLHLSVILGHWELDRPRRESNPRSSDPASYTVKPSFMDTRLIRTPHYYGQFVLFLGKKTPYIFSKFNPLNTDTSLIRTISTDPSMSVLTGFDCSLYEWLNVMQPPQQHYPLYGRFHSTVLFLFLYIKYGKL